VADDVLLVDISDQLLDGVLGLLLVGLLTFVLAGLDGVVEALDVLCVALASLAVVHAVVLDRDSLGVDLHD